MNVPDLDTILTIASKISNPITASVFAVAFLGVALGIVVKSKSKPIAWLLATGLIVLGLGPLAGTVYLGVRGVYRVRIVVLDPDRRPIKDKIEIGLSAGGETKQTESGWEVDIPPQVKPSDGNVTFYANEPDAFLAGSSTITLGKDYFPSTTIQLSKLSMFTVRGEVLDQQGKGVADAKVVLPACSLSAKTDPNGLFSFQSCVVQNQMVTIRAEKGRLADSITAPASNSMQIILRRR